MKKFAALAACCAVVAIPSALASEGNPSTAVPEAPCGKPVKLAKAAYSIQRWKRGPDGSLLQEARQALSCTDNVQSARQGIRQARDRFRLYKDYREVTPFHCHRGMDGYYAIPCTIIECESGFNWWAYNPSGASWIYQLLGWGAPAPVNFRAKVANHRIAARVYAGGAGRSNWVC